jgi:hypothetical protein
MQFNLDGKNFRQEGSDSLFHYHQKGNLVTAEFSGGTIASGHLMATMNDAGQLDLRYHLMEEDGNLLVGKCQTTIEQLPDGRLKLLEEWQGLDNDTGSGTAVVLECEG